MGAPQPEHGKLRTAAARWRDADPDPVTRAELDDLLGAGTEAAAQRLAALFGSPLSFGTAGIRGPLGPGPAHMNRLLCEQVAAAVAEVLRAEVPDAPERGVVVARDARHGSAQFCEDICSVLQDHGFVVHRIASVAPTPLLAFAVTHLQAAAGIMVTASHNPPRDNGIKVYWSDGAQIVPPIDARIAGALDLERPRAQQPGPPSGTRALHDLGAVAEHTPLVGAYLREMGRLVDVPAGCVPKIAYTALHGVGADLLELTLRDRGFGQLHAVASQRGPDPDFPTVAFPNPEEPGVMDEVTRLAAEVGADLALATDPDADRLAVAAPHPLLGWRVLTGDELGVLLAVHLLARTAGIADRLVATTVVSSRLLARVASEAGVHFAETLTGFKWLCRPALEHPRWHQVLLYEEALGYAIGPRMRDKDGIAAAAAASAMVGSLLDRGASVWDVLDDLAVRHGAHVTRNGSVGTAPRAGRGPGGALVESLAADPPRRIASLEVVSNDRPARDVLRIHLEDETRVVLRPSGTEAKLKYYCEAIEPVRDLDCEQARARASLRLESVVPALVGLLSR